MPTLRPTQSLEVRIWSTSKIGSQIIITHPEGVVKPQRYYKFVGWPATVASWFSDGFSFVIFLSGVWIFILIISRLLPNKDNQSIEGLVILNAQYFTSEHSINVTIPLNNLIIDNKLVVKANDEIGGDPQTSRPKQLTVRYRYRGKIFDKAYSQGDTVTLPE